MSEERPPRRARRSWRHWVRVVHRDAGYLCAALTLIYAISGIAVNHIDDWNPNYVIERSEQRFAPFEPTSRDEVVATLVEALDLPGSPRDAFRASPSSIELFYEGLTVEADLAAGVARIETTRERALFRDVNYLHLNHAKGLWTLFADVYAGALALLALTGIFILRGKQGLGGRGRWLVLAGLILPLIFLVARRFGAL